MGAVMAALDLTRPVFTRQGETVEIVGRTDRVLHAVVTSRYGQRQAVASYLLDGRCVEPDAHEVNYLTNDLPPSGRTSVLGGSRFPRFLEDI